MRRSLVLLASVSAVVTRAAHAEPAFEFEFRYAQGARPIAGTSFRLPRSSSGSTGAATSIDGAAFGIDRAMVRGGEVTLFGRGNVWAFGPVASVLVANGPVVPWTGSELSIIEARAGIESRATFSRDRFTGWAGAAIGLSILSIKTGVQRVVPQCATPTCPMSATRGGLWLEPRVGLEYALTQGRAGRIAFGGFLGGEPLTGFWTVGLLLSARIHFVATPNAAF